MLEKREVIWIIIAIILFEFIIFFPNPSEKNILLILIPLIIIPLNLVSKEIAANIFNLRIEHKIWHFQRWGFYSRSHFNKPIPMGLILPFILSFLSLGIIKCFVFLQFDYANNYKKRILKERGRTRRTDINEADPAYTAAWGLYSLFFLILLSILIHSILKDSFTPELAKYVFFYSFWNLVPISNLDGVKIFFGSFINWIFLVFLFLVTLPFAFGF